MHRRFYLENGQNQRFNLQDLRNGALLVSPAGLGLSMLRGYELTGDAARVVSEVLLRAPAEEGGDPRRTDYSYAIEVQAGDRFGRLDDFYASPYL